jgi:hypothetical protein
MHRSACLLIGCRSVPLHAAPCLAGCWEQTLYLSALLKGYPAGESPGSHAHVTVDACGDDQPNFSVLGSGAAPACVAEPWKNAVSWASHDLYTKMNKNFWSDIKFRLKTTRPTTLAAWMGVMPGVSRTSTCCLVVIN